MRTIIITTSITVYIVVTAERTHGIYIASTRYCEKQRRRSRMMLREIGRERGRGGGAAFRITYEIISR